MVKKKLFKSKSSIYSSEVRMKDVVAIGSAVLGLGVIKDFGKYLVSFEICTTKDDAFKMNDLLIKRKP